MEEHGPTSHPLLQKPSRAPSSLSTPVSSPLPTGRRALSSQSRHQPARSQKPRVKTLRTVAPEAQTALQRAPGRQTAVPGADPRTKVCPCRTQVCCQAHDWSAVPSPVPTAVRTDAAIQPPHRTPLSLCAEAGRPSPQAGEHTHRWERAVPRRRFQLSVGKMCPLSVPCREGRCSGN